MIFKIKYISTCKKKTNPAFKNTYFAELRYKFFELDDFKIFWLNKHCPIFFLGYVFHDFHEVGVHSNTDSTFLLKIFFLLCVSVLAI